MRPRLFQPYKLTVRFTLWAVWAVVAVGVISVGLRNPMPNHPLGLLFLGSGLLISGLLALASLVSRAAWDFLVEPEYDVPAARQHFYFLLGLGVVGAVMLGFAVDRLF